MKKLLISLAVISVVITMVAGATQAIFTDQAKSEGNTFATGTVDIETDGEAFLPVDFSDLVPGWEESGSLEVFNDGSLKLRYAMTIEIDTNEEGICNQLLALIERGGETLYSGPLGEAFFGNPAQGADDGDRALDADDSEILDFTFSLPFDTDNDYQGQTCVVNFVFDAEQTTSNP